MSVAATTSDTADDLLDNPLWILDCKVPQLKAAWQKLDQSGFEHTSNKHLRVELIRRAFYKRFIAERASTSTSGEDETSVSSLSPDAASPANTPAPVKSFREAVKSLAVPHPSPGSSSVETRLAAAELLLRDHKQKLRDLDQKAEALDRKTREFNLVIYNMPDSAQEDDNGVKTLLSLADKCMPEYEFDHDAELTRIGAHRQDQKRPRPIRLRFGSLEDKHAFLKHAKALKEVGLRYDDDLTRLQQNQRSNLSADFNVLKPKGLKPFYRGSSLKFRHCNKTYSCKKDGAHNAATA